METSSPAVSPTTCPPSCERSSLQFESRSRPTPANIMPSHNYAPTKNDKFAFGIWCLQNRGRDPFGDQTRPELPALDCIRGLAQRNCYGFEFHDNDLIPFEASAAQRDQILRDVKNAIGDWGIKATMATTNLFYHPIFKDGAFTSTDPAVRAFATQKVLNALDIAAQLGTQVFV